MKFSKHQRILLFIGWLLFWLSLFLPVNTSRGGLTDTGRSYVGFINLFYSIGSIFVLPSLVFDHKDSSFVFSTILMSGVGICDLLMIFAAPVLLFVKKTNSFTKYIMTFCAVYICTAGTVANYHFRPILYGHYVWCSSFIIVAIALYLKITNTNDFS